MGIIKRQTIQNSAYTYAGVAVGFLTQGLLFPNIFSKAQIGLLTLLGSLSLILLQFSLLGLNGAAGRYFPYFRNPNRQHNGYLLLSTLTAIVGFGVSVLGLWLVRPWVVAHYAAESPLFVQYYYLLIPLTFFTVFFSVFDNYARFLYDAVTGTLLQQLMLRVFILAAGLGYWAGWLTFEQFLYSWLGCFLLTMLLMLAQVIRSGWLYYGWHYLSVGTVLRRNLIRYSVLSLATALSSQVILAIDKMMLADSHGLAQTGVYGTASYFAAVIAIPATALYKASGALVAEFWKNNEIGKIAVMYRKSCLTQLLAGGLVFVGIAANLPNIFRFLPAGYEAGYYVILWLGFGKLIDMATGINGMILATSRFYAYDSLFFVALVVITIVLNRWLIPLYGINGAAIAAAIATALYNLVRTVFVGVAFRMQPFTWRSGVGVLLLVGVWWLAVQWPYPTPAAPILTVVLDMAGRLLVITSLYVGAVLALRLSPEANDLVASGWARISRFR